jgi:hypothetical protein
MLFSIIIPTYNRLFSVKETLASVFAQTFTDYEIIFVDDGSTDGTVDFVQSLDSSIKVIRQKNRGPGAARNRGVQEARGQYIAFLDSDDLWFPWTLATYHELIQQHPSSLICAAITEFDEKLPEMEQKPITIQCFSDYFATANDYGFVGSGALVVKRSVFEAAKGFEEKMIVIEDHDFFMRVETPAGLIRIRSPVTVAVRRHSKNVSASLPMLYSGAMELLLRESEGRYAGGKSRKLERWQLLSRVVRPIALSCLKAGLVREAWNLYRRSLQINARLGRFRFVAGFPIYGLLKLPMRRRGST